MHTVTRLVYGQDGQGTSLFIFCPLDKSSFNNIIKQNAEPQRSAVNKRSFSHQTSSPPRECSAASLTSTGPQPCRQLGQSSLVSFSGSRQGLAWFCPRLLFKTQREGFLHLSECSFSSLWGTSISDRMEHYGNVSLAVLWDWCTPQSQRMGTGLGRCLTLTLVL